MSRLTSLKRPWPLKSLIIENDTVSFEGKDGRKLESYSEYSDQDTDFFSVSGKETLLGTPRTLARFLSSKIQKPYSEKIAFHSSKRLAVFSPLFPVSTPLNSPDTQVKPALHFKILSPYLSEVVTANSIRTHMSKVAVYPFRETNILDGKSSFPFLDEEAGNHTSPLSCGHPSVKLQPELCNDSVKVTTDLANSIFDEVDSITSVKKSHKVDGSLKSGVVGGMMSNLLKFFVKQKFESCGKLNVTIGGNSIQLLMGYSTGFKVNIKNFVFEGCGVSEADAQTVIEVGKVVRFNLNSVRTGGKLFASRVPMVMSMTIKESDLTIGLKSEGNFLLRSTLESFWEKFVGTEEPMPSFKVRLQNGFALLETIEDEGVVRHEIKGSRQVAVKFLIETVDLREQLVAVIWEATCGKNRNYYTKVVDLPKDVKFLSFYVGEGLMAFSYKFELDL